jgi:oxygen-dependent protoporphyrinogen oxidase
MKRIAIIGGGISGLTVLHYLKQRFKDTVDIMLFEREASCGGTIRSLHKDSCLFEYGPNGFLGNQPATFALIQELGMADAMITAGTASRGRYLKVNRQLQAVPLNPIALMTTPLFSIPDKWSLLMGCFKRNISKDTSIYDYVSRRFSASIAETLIDPFINGIYAGNIKHLHMGSAFPKFKKSRLHSFKRGMAEIIDALSRRYQANIQTSAEIASLPDDADAVIIATPAYAAANIVEAVNPPLAGLLNQMPYAPIAVAGLVFPQDTFHKMPEGFGYLVPSKEKKDVLGVLIESNVFEGRAGKGQIMLRVMFGGMHHPAIINDDPQTILSKACQEIDDTYGVVSPPLATFVKIWPKAIPQYELNYPSWRQSMAQELAKTEHLYLCANYLDGISFNDCVNNAQKLASTLFTSGR